MNLSRREFGKVAVAGALGWATGASGSGASPGSNADRLTVNLFSKHLQFLDFKDMAEATVEMGFDGLDLTVRPGGHVPPAKAVDELPRAVEAMKAVGLRPEMFVSGITSVDDEDGIKSLDTAAKLGFKYYRTGYYKTDKKLGLQENLAIAKRAFQRLAAFNESVGLHGAYQNHAGQNIGAYVTDLPHLFEGLDPRWAGCQYDIRHATVEGGTAWPLGLSYLKNYIKTVPIKDFTWKKVGGAWKVENVPLGTGMVDFDRYFKLLREYGVKPIVSMHYEYELGGADHGKREITISRKELFSAMKRDLAVVHRLWAESAA